MALFPRPGWPRNTPIVMHPVVGIWNRLGTFCCVDVFDLVECVFVCLSVYPCSRLRYLADRGPVIQALSVDSEYLRNEASESGAVVENPNDHNQTNYHPSSHSVDDHKHCSQAPHNNVRVAPTTTTYVAELTFEAAIFLIDDNQSPFRWIMRIGNCL